MDNIPNLTPPNEKGYQFAVNKYLTDFAQTVQENWDIQMPPVDMSVLEVWKNNNFYAYLIVDSKTNEEIDRAFDFDAVIVKLELYKLNKRNYEQ